MYTWRNHSKELCTYICERLDRATANNEWCDTFPNYVVVNGEPRHSDHRPIIVHMEGIDRGWMRGDRLFRFEARWLQEDGCEDVIREAWENNCLTGAGGVAQGLREVATKMSTWSKEVLGELDGKIKQANADLERCMKETVSEGKIKEETRLRCLLEELKKRSTQSSSNEHICGGCVVEAKT